MEVSGRNLSDGDIGYWMAVANRRPGSPAELQANMQLIYSGILAIDFNRLDPAAVKLDAKRITDNLFDLYLTLRDRAAEWRLLGLMSDGAPTGVRNTMRILRYTIDLIGEVANGFPRLAKGEKPHSGFQGPADWTLLHPSLREGHHVDFRPGDVLLVRGSLHNSAAIARIGDVDSQFSHVGIVHVDEVGERWLVEALIEEGSVWSPLDFALGHGISRAILFRHRDPVLAAKAASLVAGHVAANRGILSWIPYDFSMELDGQDRFFCSKLVRWAYVNASGGAMALPTFGTRLDMKNRDFFDRIGVTAVDTCAPADFEIEPAFDLIAEWRDYRVTPSLRMQDLLMTKIFEWMESGDYQFRERLPITVAALAGRLTSWTPDFFKNILVAAGLPKIPPNMTARTITTIGMLHNTAQPILERLLRLDEDRIKTTGRPMHPAEVLAELARFEAANKGRIGYLVSASRQT